MLLLTIFGSLLSLLQIRAQDADEAFEQNGCQLCACPIGSPARGCDPMPFVLWHDLMVKGCPTEGGDIDNRDKAQKVTRWFRRVNRFTDTDRCEPYVFPYCPEIDHNLWRSPRTREECEFYCYSFDEQRERGFTGGNNLPPADAEKLQNELDRTAAAQKQKTT